jgi:putative flippase GtrA
MVVGSEVTPARWARLNAVLRLLRQVCAPRFRAFLDRLDVVKGALLSRVPQRFHAITDEIAKFGTIGLINLGVNFAVFNALLVAVQGSEVKAKAVATTVAATCAYFLNRYWTYRHRPKTTLRREYTLFFLFNAVGLVIEATIVAMAKYGFDQTNLVVLNICTFFGIALGTVFRFWAYRTHVFKKVPAAEAEGGPVLASGAPTRLAGPAGAGAGLADSELADSELADSELADSELADSELADSELADSELAGSELAGSELVGSELEDDEGDLREELVQLELDEMLQADDPIRR